MQTQAIKAKVVNVVDMSLLGLLLGLSFGGAFHHILSLM